MSSHCLSNTTHSPQIEARILFNMQMFMDIYAPLFYYLWVATWLLIYIMPCISLDSYFCLLLYFISDSCFLIDMFTAFILLLLTCWHIELNISIMKSNALRNLFFHGFVMDTCVCLSIKREVWFLVTKCGEFHYVLTKQSLSIQC